MNALRNLQTIRDLECEIIKLYQEVAKTQLGIASAALNVNFESVKALRDAPDSLCNNLKHAFQSNSTSIFTLAITNINVPDDIEIKVQEVDPVIQKIRICEKKILLEIRELCLSKKELARTCIGLSDEMIYKISETSPSNIQEICYIAHRSGPLLKIKTRREKAFIEMIKMASKPCGKVLGLMLDRMAG